jgi:hypothetical protein
MESMLSNLNLVRERLEETRTRLVAARDYDARPQKEWVAEVKSYLRAELLGRAEAFQAAQTEFDRRYEEAVREHCWFGRYRDSTHQMDAEIWGPRKRALHDLEVAREWIASLLKAEMSRRNEVLYDQRWTPLQRAWRDIQVLDEISAENLAEDSALRLEVVQRRRRAEAAVKDLERQERSLLRQEQDLTPPSPRPSGPTPNMRRDRREWNDRGGKRS